MDDGRHNDQNIADLTSAIFKNLYAGINRPSTMCSTKESIYSEIKWLHEVIDWTYTDAFVFALAEEFLDINAENLKPKIRNKVYDKLNEY